VIDLPPELAALINAERAAKVASAAERVVVRAKLAASVGAAPLGSAAVGATLAGTGKAFAIVAITLAAGGGAALALRDDAPSARAPTHEVASSTRGLAEVVPAPHEGPVQVATEPTGSASQRDGSAPLVATAYAPARASNVAPSPVIVPPLVVAARKPDVASEPSLLQSDVSRPPASVSATSAPAEGSTGFEPSAGEVVTPPVRSQVELIRAAWAALSAGDATGALALADEDARARRGGPLAEEREVVRLVSLARLHRTADAQHAATRFVALYPTSVHRALIERAFSDQESR
jgi:hypothetical protein